MGCTHCTPRPPCYFHVHDVSGRTSGRLEVCHESLRLHTEDGMCVEWRLSHVRRYGYHRKIFTFECGTRSASGPGVYAFRCRRAYLLYLNVKNAIEQNLESVKLPASEKLASRHTTALNDYHHLTRRSPSVVSQEPTHPLVQYCTKSDKEELIKDEEERNNNKPPHYQYSPLCLEVENADKYYLNVTTKPFEQSGRYSIIESPSADPGDQFSVHSYHNLKEPPSVHYSQVETNYKGPSHKKDVQVHYSVIDTCQTKALQELTRMRTARRESELKSQ